MGVVEGEGWKGGGGWTRGVDALLGVQKSWQGWEGGKIT